MPRLSYYLSPTRISIFKRCPRKYFYSYLLFAPADFTPYFLYLGKLVHSSIAYAESTGRPFKPFLLDLLGQFHFREEEESAKVYHLALPLMANWQKWQAERQNEELRGIEKPFEISTARGTRLKGRMDRVSYEVRREEWVISDYKTGSSKVPRGDAGDDLQMRCYALALGKLEKEVKNLRVELVYLRDRDVRAAKIDPERLDQTETEMDTLHDEIISTTHYPAMRGWYCKMCRFKDRCRSGHREEGEMVFYLKNLAESEDYHERAKGAAKLGELNLTGAIPALSRAVIKDPEILVRREAAQSLGKMGDEWTISSLVRTLSQEALTNEALLALKLMAQRSLCRRMTRPVRYRLAG
ncbi:Dna2/Cas4 domain-containing protein [Candidatus Aerophobetes bacterium]|uniref:Dna2/Cas4 domain-containing protein n=1 Tax=Aerophobetes bacterium TaxID=2030807 RepID=A0A523VWD0_UNCAE|nr:MAG: Dna2/Cas4 domain-containing protein [Candidatus Aerophobetes bacterium]